MANLSAEHPFGQASCVEAQTDRRSEFLTCTACAAGAAAIFAADLITPADIRLHGLYVFPLAIVARYSTRLRWSVGVLLLTTALQFAAYSIQADAAPSFISDVGIPLTTSVLTLFLARAWRLSYLRAVTQAARDPLTELGNRRAFFAALDAEIAKQRRYAGSFSLAVLDLDGFKELNDSKGHRAGDEVLRLVADVLRTRTRNSDTLGRIGGDEFAILMPSTESDCAAMLHDLCVTIANRTAAAGCDVTASIGCKTFRSPPESATEALQLADRVMYEAKLRGKNRSEYCGRDTRAA